MRNYLFLKFLVEDILKFSESNDFIKPNYVHIFVTFNIVCLLKFFNFINFIGSVLKKNLFQVNFCLQKY